VKKSESNKCKQNSLNSTLIFLYIIVFCSSCGWFSSEEKKVPVAPRRDTFDVIYTKYSNLPNTYKGFNSPEAINRIADIENEYFNNFDHSVSRYYGTEWYEKYGRVYISRGKRRFDAYKEDLALVTDAKPDSMHCTLYAIEALKAGMGTKFDTLEKYHKEIWRGREHAGWSIGHILTKYFNWRAYLFISEKSKEYKDCLKSYVAGGLYDVYDQPDIPLERAFFIESEQDKIEELLLQNEFGWGFSYQGWHTWITRFDTLKECRWLGAPGKKYRPWNSKIELFTKTKFLEYNSFNSHIIVFPPK